MTTRPAAPSTAPLTGKYQPATLRAAWWALLALRRTRRRLRRDGLSAVAPRPPASLPSGARRGVNAVVRRRPSTCLERALVLQSWLAAHGQRHEVIVGVTRQGGAVLAHAWLDFETETDPVARDYQELLRRPAP